MNGRPVNINGHGGPWNLTLPDHRAARPEWPFWEAHRLAVTVHIITTMHDRTRRQPVVWDIGAEEGDFPALYTQLGANVVLAESNPKVWPNIRWIWEANGLPMPAGWFVGLVGDVDDMEPNNPRPGFDPADYAACWGTVTEWPTVADGPIIGDHGFVVLDDGRSTVPQAKIDTMIKWGFPTPDLITMDVEGGERFVIEGAADTLRDHRPLILASLHPQFVGQDRTDSLVADMMLVHRYHARRLCTDHEEHWVFVPREKADDWPGLVPA